MRLTPFRVMAAACRRSAFVIALTFALLTRTSLAQEVDPAFSPGASAEVFVLGVQPDGKLLLGGNFRTVNGTPRARLARFNPDGTLDTSFTPPPVGSVLALTVQGDGRVLIATGVGTVPGQFRVMRLNANGTADPSFNVEFAGVVSALLVQPDGKILAGGTFSSAAGESRSGLARLNADGTLDRGFNPTFAGSLVPAPDTTSIDALGLTPEGHILVGGNFTEVGGLRRSALVRLLADGSVDAGFEATFSARVSVVLVQPDGRVLVAGSFATVNGAARRGLVRLNPPGSTDGSFAGVLGNGSVRTIVRQADGKLVVGGMFTTINGEARSFLARLQPDGSLDRSFQADVGGAVGGSSPGVYAAVVSAPGHVVIGGAFNTVQGQTRAGAARVFSGLDAAGESRLSNLAVRTRLGAAGDIFTLGFGIAGSGEKRLLLRGIGPAMIPLGVADAAANPSLEIFDGQRSVGTNDNWGGGTSLAEAFAATGAFTLPGASLDAATVTALGARPHTVQLSATGAGVVLGEVYDMDPASPGWLVNLSARAEVRAGDVLIAGFTLNGSGTKTILVRGVGPTLGGFGVTGTLSNPRLQLFQGSVLLRENEDWSGAELAAAFARTGAFALPEGSRDAALLITLPAGSYTAQVSGGVGQALVEVYEVRP